jgi:hypothetical protein
MPGSHTSTSADHTRPEPASGPAGLQLVSSAERGLSGLPCGRRCRARRTGRTTSQQARHPLET